MSAREDEKEPDIEIVGEAADEPEAMMLIKSLEPQIVVTDFNVRSTGKIFAKQIKSQHPSNLLTWASLTTSEFNMNFNMDLNTLCRE